jgi:hypothetical protein
MTAEPAGEGTIHLDGVAQTWAVSRTREPRSRLDRLGVRDGHRVAAVGRVEEGFVGELRDRLAEVVTGGSVPAGADIIFLAATQREELGRIPGLAHFIAPGGVLWVIRPRGGREITEQDVAVSAKAAGMCVGRPIRFSPTHTADRLTPPAEPRRQGGRRSPRR